LCAVWRLCAVWCCEALIAYEFRRSLHRTCWNRHTTPHNNTTPHNTPHYNTMQPQQHHNSALTAYSLLLCLPQLLPLLLSVGKSAIVTLQNLVTSREAGHEGHEKQVMRSRITGSREVKTKFRSQDAEQHEQAFCLVSRRALVRALFPVLRILV